MLYFISKRAYCKQFIHHYDVHVAKHLMFFLHRNANVLTIDETSGVLNQTINGVYELKTVGVDYT